MLMNEFKRFEIGTPQCGLICALIGVALAFLLIFLGFWKTLFIVLLGCIGGFVGAVKDKAQFCKNLINKILPPKDN